MSNSVFWHYDLEEKWFKKEIAYHVYEDNLLEFLIDSGFSSKHKIQIRVDWDFIYVYEHKNHEMFALHIKMDNLEKVVFASNLPSMFNLLEEMQSILTAHLKIKEMLEDKNV